MGERWVHLALIEDERLMCDKCDNYFQHGVAHLYLDVDNELVETMCDKCWKKEGLKE